MRNLRLALLAAALGAIALVFCFPRTDPAARYPVSIDRARAVQLAQQLSAKYGVNTANWRTEVSTVTDDKLRSTARLSLPIPPPHSFRRSLGACSLLPPPDRSSVSSCPPTAIRKSGVIIVRLALRCNRRT